MPYVTLEPPSSNGSGRGVHPDDPLGFFRGLVLALVVSVALWAAIAILIWWLV